MAKKPDNSKKPVPAPKIIKPKVDRAARARREQEKKRKRDMKVLRGSARAARRIGLGGEQKEAT